MESLDSGLKKCNFCNEDIPAGSGRCPYCGSILDVVVDQDAFEAPREEKPSGEAPVDIQTAGTEPDTGVKAPVYKAPSGFREYKRQPLGNGLKVFLTIIFTLIPGLGQLAGIITAIVFMNMDDDPDRKSFGVAILIASLVMFVLACIVCFIGAITLSVYQTSGYLPQ